MPAASHRAAMPLSRLPTSASTVCRGLSSNIPLEYLGTAINWLAAQPSVDPNRIGVIGASRGAELALFLGGLYPRLRVVVAYMPSHVVVRGCCNPRTWFFAWTLGGRPIAAMPPPARRDPIEAQHAEIQVERIHGPILLVSGKDDGVWPSAESAAKSSRGYSNIDSLPVPESLVYDHAGHGITRTVHADHPERQAQSAVGTSGQPGRHPERHGKGARRLLVEDDRVRRTRVSG